MKRTIRVGIVQQACTNDLKINLEKLHRNIASVAQAGAHNLLFYRNYIIPPISVKQKIHLYLIWQSLSPDRQPDFIVK